MPKNASGTSACFAERATAERARCASLLGRPLLPRTGTSEPRLYGAICETLRDGGGSCHACRPCRSRTRYGLESGADRVGCRSAWSTGTAWLEACGAGPPGCDLDVMLSTCRRGRSLEAAAASRSRQLTTSATTSTCSRAAGPAGAVLSAGLLLPLAWFASRTGWPGRCGLHALQGDELRCIPIQVWVGPRLAVVEQQPEKLRAPGVEQH